jgi:tetratricopeptide (TPR) repeat protein
MQEGLGMAPGLGLESLGDELEDLGDGTGRRQLHDRAYYLDLLGDSHSGLGRHDAAVEAYRQAADAFKAQGASCSHALCLLKISGSYLSLGEPWHAIGYLEACLPLLRKLGLARHQAIGQRRLSACQAGLVHARLASGGAGPRPAAIPPGQLKRRRRCPPGQGRFVLCPVPTTGRGGSAMRNSRPGEQPFT